MNKKLLKLPIYLIITLLLSGVAFSIPSIPHQFYGDVFINGAPASDGQLIVAKIGGIDVASTTTQNSQYGYAPYIFYIQDPDSNRLGKTISFYVNDVKAASFVFNNGMSTRLDLSVTQDIPPANTGGNGGSGGSGGGGAAPITTSTEEETNTTDTNETAEPVLISQCTPNWVCSGWLDCVNGIEKRVCTDTNSCGEDANKPSESQECEVPDNPFEKPNPLAAFGTAITGAVVGGGIATWASLLALLGVVGLAIFLVYRKK